MSYSGIRSRKCSGGHGKSVAPAGVDEWLKAELRLAERQGILRGYRLSPVQSQALQILNLLDEIDKFRRQYDLFRAALTANGNYEPKGLWTEFSKLFQDQPTEEVREETAGPANGDPDNIKFDYSAVEWRTPSEAREEYEDLMKKVAALSTGALNGNQVKTFPGQGEWR
jgi:hypothetical protein